MAVTLTDFATPGVADGTSTTSVTCTLHQSTAAADRRLGSAIVPPEGRRDEIPASAPVQSAGVVWMAVIAIV